MYLKSLKINNFRKFNTTNNIVEFVDPKSNFEDLEKESLSIAPSTTLIVGKNNSGKTTVTKALNKLINNSVFCSKDFNFSYLNQLLHQYQENKFDLFPVIEFEMKVVIDSNNNDLVSNLIPFMNIENVQHANEQIELKFIIKYELKEESNFKKNIVTFIDENQKQDLFNQFLKLIDDSDFEMNYYNIEGEIIDNYKFKVNDLIEIKTISANKILNDNCLSQTFNKIIKYRYKSDVESKEFSNLNDEINSINNNVTGQISKSHTGSINNVLNKIESSNKLKVNLSSDLTFDKLMKSLIKYEYKEGEFNIPEGQFGLGYSNLMAIIGELIDYIDRYSNDDFHSKINLICIEEPEAFMHPQMQEIFIKHIDDAVSYLLENTEKTINSQLIITTHSSHILNSKIHSGNSFNNISYITDVDNSSNVVNLNDIKVMGNIEEEKLNGETKKEAEKRKRKELKFLKKHIKYKVSELFFSDAVIFVEGITEEILLSYHIDEDENLNKYYISIFNIDGAHGHIYHPLIKLLKVPTLIITDLDIKRNKLEKEKFKQVENLDNTKTTNNTIIKFNDGPDINEIDEYFKNDNLYITFQDKINNYYPTSFEEAIILTNYNNPILNSALKKTKPQIYKGILGKEKNKENIKKQSYKLQRKLTKSKSDFANELLYELITNESDSGDNSFTYPNYITEGFNWLLEQLDGRI